MRKIKRCDLCGQLTLSYNLMMMIKAGVMVEVAICTVCVSPETDVSESSKNPLFGEQ